MSDLYNRVQSLCQGRGISIGKMCNELGISRGNLTELKMGRIRTLKADNLAKISGYFGVSIDFLLGKEKAPTPEGERYISDDDIKFALFGTREIDDDVLDRVRQFAKFAQKNENNK